MRPGAGRPLIPALLCTLAGPGSGETRPWRRACAGETESPLTRDSPLPYIRRWPRSGQDQGRRGAPGRPWALCGVWSVKGSLPGMGGGTGGHSTRLKEGSTFLAAARQVPRPCGRNLRCLCAVRAERGVGDRIRSVGGVGGGVCAWRVAWGLATPGREFGFCSLLWDEERGEFGISLPLSKEHSCFSMCQPLAGMPWWRPEIRSEAVAGAQVT